MPVPPIEEAFRLEEEEEEEEEEEDDDDYDDDGRAKSIAIRHSLYYSKLRSHRGVEWR